MIPRTALHLPATREAWRRHALLTGTVSLTALSIGPIFGHHFAPDGGALLPSADRIGVLCVEALKALLIPVHGAFHLALLAGLCYAVWSRLRAWHGMTRLLARLDGEPPHPGCALWRAAVEAGISPMRLRVVPWLANPAFTARLRRPVVYVSGELAERLAFEEIVAVLAHEAVHVRRRDPLRLSVLRFLADVLFWLPAIGRLADDVADEMEILADDSAARARPLVLASALLSVAAWRRPERAVDPLPFGAVGFSRYDMLERRVRRLAGEIAPRRSNVSAASLAAAALMLALAWSAGMAAPPDRLSAMQTGVQTAARVDCT